MAVLGLTACGTDGDPASPDLQRSVTEGRAFASGGLLQDVVLTAGFGPDGELRRLTPPIDPERPLGVELHVRSRDDHRGDDVLSVHWRRSGEDRWSTSWRLPQPTGTLRATLPAEVHQQPGDYILEVSFRGDVLRSISVEVRRG